MRVLIEKPQFDPNALKAGMAVRIKHNSYSSEKLPYGSALYKLDAAALLVKVNPLEIKATYFSTDQEKLVEATIPVDFVAADTIILSVLE